MTETKQLPPWVQKLVDAGMIALAVFLAAKFGIVLPIPPTPAPVQPTVLVIGQPAGPLTTAQK